MSNLIISHRRSFLLLTIFSVSSIVTFSFPEGNGIPFRGFPKKLQITATDTLPQREKLKRISVAEAPLWNSTETHQSIENAMRQVEQSMQQLKTMLKQKEWDKEGLYYRSNPENFYLREIEDASNRALLEANSRANFDQIKKQMDMVNRLRLADVRRTMNFARLSLEQNRKNLQLAMLQNRNIALQNAKLSLLQANGQLARIKEFKEDLEKDGLIKKDEPYTIEIKEGRLYINDKKQRNSILKKYKEKYGEYFEHKNLFRIQNDAKRRHLYDEGEVI